MDHQIRVFSGELLILLVTIQSVLNLWKLIRPHISGLIFALMPLLELVVGARGAGALRKLIRREFAALHGGNGGDLLKQTLFFGIIHVCD